MFRGIQFLHLPQQVYSHQMNLDIWNRISYDSLEVYRILIFVIKGLEQNINIRKNYFTRETTMTIQRFSRKSYMYSGITIRVSILPNRLLHCIDGRPSVEYCYDDIPIYAHIEGICMHNERGPAFVYGDYHGYFIYGILVNEVGRTNTRHRGYVAGIPTGYNMDLFRQYMSIPDDALDGFMFDYSKQVLMYKDPEDTPVGNVAPPSVVNAIELSPHLFIGEMYYTELYDWINETKHMNVSAFGEDVDIVQDAPLPINIDDDIQANLDTQYGAPIMADNYINNNKTTDDLMDYQQSILACESDDEPL